MATPTVKKIESSIPDMTIGEERKCLNQLYRAARVSPNQPVDPNWLLYNGLTAGAFCTKYVIGHYNKRKLKELSKKAVAEEEEQEEVTPEQIDHVPPPVEDDPTPGTSVKSKRPKRGHADNDEVQHDDDDTTIDDPEPPPTKQKKGKSSRKKVDKNLDTE